MAGVDLKISELPETRVISGTEEFVVVKSGANRKVTASTLMAKTLEGVDFGAMETQLAALQKEVDTKANATEVAAVAATSNEASQKAQAASEAIKSLKGLHVYNLGIDDNFPVGIPALYTDNDGWIVSHSRLVSLFDASGQMNRYLVFCMIHTINTQTYTDSQSYQVYIESEEGTYDFVKSYTSATAPEWVKVAFHENIASEAYAGLMSTVDRGNMRKFLSSISIVTNAATGELSLVGYRPDGTKTEGESIPLASEEKAGIMSKEDKVVLDKSITKIDYEASSGVVATMIEIGDGVPDLVPLPNATETSAGVISAADKKKLDGCFTATVDDEVLILSAYQDANMPTTVVLYEKVQSTWATSDIALWPITGNATSEITTDGLKFTGTNIAYSALKSLNISQNAIITLSASIKAGNATGRAGSYDYIYMCGIYVKLYGQEQQAIIEDEQSANPVQATGFVRGGTYEITIKVDTAKDFAECTISGDATASASTDDSGIVFVGVFDGVKIGHYREGAEGYASEITINSISISETK